MSLETAEFKHVKLDTETGDLSEHDLGDFSGKFVDVVPSSGYGEIFSQPLIEQPKTFNEFFSQTATDVVFSFDKPASLSNFGHLLTACLSPLPQLRTDVQVAVFVFSSSNFATLAEWKPIKRQHGDSKQAQEHVGLWMDAVQTLPNSVNVHVVLCQPWRDYRALRVATIVLREPQRRMPTVGVKRERWTKIPDADFHLALTTASMQGLEFQGQRDISEDKARELVDYGCRGFRAEPVSQ